MGTTLKLHWLFGEPHETKALAGCEPRNAKPYRNLYQTGLNLNMPEKAETCVFLGKTHIMLDAWRRGSPIPTLASIRNFFIPSYFHQHGG